jgi:hypothetical protein
MSCPLLMNLWQRNGSWDHHSIPLPTTGQMPSLDSLRATEWSDAFERAMRDRLIMGSFRYGLIGADGKPQYDRVSCCERRLALYRETHNMEHLVDIANLCQMEFVEGQHPDRHFAASDDGVHTGMLNG